MINHTNGWVGITDTDRQVDDDLTRCLYESLTKMK